MPLVTSSRPNVLFVARQAAELEAEMVAIENAELRLIDDITTHEVGLERSDIRVDDFVILWVPVSRQV